MLYNDSFSTEGFTIQVIDSIVRVSGIFKLHKSISILEDDFSYSSVALKELLYITISCRVM